MTCDEQTTIKSALYLTLSLFDQLASVEEGAPMVAALVARAAHIQGIAQGCRGTALFKGNAEKFARLRAELEQFTHPSQYLARAWNALVDQVAGTDNYLAVSAAVVALVPLVALYLPEFSQ